MGYDESQGYDIHSVLAQESSKELRKRIQQLEAENARLKEQRDKAANLLRTAITSGGIRVMNYKLLARARNEILKEIESEE